MQRFRVDLKAFLDLDMPNQSCLDVTKYFGWGFLGKKPQTFMVPIYSTTVLHDSKSLPFIN